MGRSRRVRVSVLTILVSCTLAYAPAVAGPDVDINRVFATYSSGDYGVVSRSFAAPADFQPLRLDKPHIFDDWLRAGAWDIKKAAFTIELARAANEVAPTKTFPLVAAGQRYFAIRPRSSTPL